MSDILCIYYSRSGNTKSTCEEIAAQLEAETVEIRDEAERSGTLGWLRCGMDAMSKSTRPLSRFETERPLADYKLVILGTPVWAGRCSSVMRALLKEHGGELENVAYVITRGGDSRYREVFDQMDGYLKKKHQAGVSLRCNAVGYHFWQEQFIRSVREWLDGDGNRENDDAGQAQGN